MKRALLVGIDKYDCFSPLSGCGNDVAALEPLLARNEDGSLNFDCESRTSRRQRVTRDGLLMDLDRLLAPSADVALLYFAGHGSQLLNDVSLVTQEGSPATPGVVFSKILAKISTSDVREVVVILDCCFSGGAAGLPQLQAAALLRSGVSILTASRSDQASAETPQHRGLFSTYLEGALNGGAADALGKITVAGVYAHLSELFGPWDQRPMLKANVDRLHELRLTAPAVAVTDLRSLVQLFARAEAEIWLDPSFEPTVEPVNPENEKKFRVLQICRAAKLVEPVGELHLYYTAINSRSCRLTPLGRHYWELIRQGRI